MPKEGYAMIVLLALAVVALVPPNKNRPADPKEPVPSTADTNERIRREVDRFERCLVTEDVNTCVPPRLILSQVELCYGEGVINGRPPAWEICRDYD